MTNLTGELLWFVEYTNAGGEVCAVFDHVGPAPDEGGRFILTYEDCRRRLVNLVHNGFAHDQTIKALARWP